MLVLDSLNIAAGRVGWHGGATQLIELGALHIEVGSTSDTLDRALYIG